MMWIAASIPLWVLGAVCGLFGGFGLVHSKSGEHICFSLVFLAISGGVLCLAAKVAQ